MVCKLREDNWCYDHEEFHHGRLRELALMDNDLGESYRTLWTDIKNHPEKYVAQPQPCAKIEHKPTELPSQWDRFYKKIKDWVLPYFRFVKALWNHAKDGFNKVSKAEKDRRLSICQRCPHREPKGDVPQAKWVCTQCGCWLDLKSEWRSQACPLGYWAATANNQNKSSGCGCRH